MYADYNSEEDSDQQHEDDDDQRIYHEHEDQVNKIVASPSQPSFFELDQSAVSFKRSLFAPDTRNNDNPQSKDITNQSSIHQARSSNDGEDHQDSVSQQQ